MKCLVVIVAANAASNSTPVSLHVSGVDKFFGKNQILEDISLSIKKGEFVSIIGPSGCGKTTLLRLLAGLESLSAGSVQIDGLPIEDACSKQEVGVAFQRPALIPSLTARRNVQTTLDLCTRASKLTPEQMLKDFGLGDFMDHYPHQLSGGMHQRVNIACAMVHAPSLLLLDEPFGALDEMTRATMCAWLANILQESKQTTVLVTHSIEEAVTLSDKIVVLAARPGCISEILDVTLPRPRKTWEDDVFIAEMKRVRTALKNVEKPISVLSIQNREAVVSPS